MIRYIFKNKPDYDKAVEALEWAIKNVGPGTKGPAQTRYNYGTTPSDLEIRIMDKANEKATDDIFQEKGVTGFTKKLDETSWIGPEKLSVANFVRKLAKSIVAYDFSSVQANLPFPVSQEIIDWGMANIPDEDLAENGREDDIHVTVKYGLHNNSWDDIRSFLIQEQPFEIVLGPVSIFPGDEHDVVKISVTSPNLVRLNQAISDCFEHTDTHPEYIPHVTIAYVKPGLGQKYDGRKDFDGKKVDIGTLLFSGNNNCRMELPLAYMEKKSMEFSQRMVLVDRYMAISDQLKHLVKRLQIDQPSDAPEAKEVKQEMVKLEQEQKEIINKLTP